jgi:hypothetical protein
LGGQASKGSFVVRWYLSRDHKLPELLGNAALVPLG